MTDLLPGTSVGTLMFTFFFFLIKVQLIYNIRFRCTAL